MRTINADLTTAQQAASHTPYVRLNFRSRDRVTTRTYDTTGNRILMVRQDEGRLGGRINVPSLPFAVAAVVRLNDYDSSLIPLNWIGYRLDIGWGYNTVSGDRYSEGEPLIVIRQAGGSEGGQIFVDLYCIDLWGLLDIFYAGVTGASFFWGTTKGAAADTSIRHILMEMFASALEGEGDDFVGMGAAVLLDESATTYTAYTTESKNTTADNVGMLPAVPAAGDAFFLGFATQFDRVSIDLTTVGVGTWTMALEYWNGTAWVSLTGATYAGNQIKNLTAGELQIVDFERPTDWATVNLQTHATAIPGGAPRAAFPNSALYYMRFRVDTFSAVTTSPKATRIFVAQDFGIALDTAEATQGDDETPQYQSAISSIVSVIEEILGFTRLGVVLKKDGFHLKWIDPAASTDYTYGGTHVAIAVDLEENQPIPNRVEYTDLAQNPAIVGTANDATSQSFLGLLPELIAHESAVDAGTAQDLADRRMAELTRDRAFGTVIAPLQVNQEIWDVVRIEDARTGLNVDGYAAKITREYAPGQYFIRIGMGGAEVDWVLSKPVQDILAGRGITDLPPHMLTSPGWIRILGQMAQMIQDEAAGKPPPIRDGRPAILPAPPTAPADVGKAPPHLPVTAISQPGVFIGTQFVPRVPTPSAVLPPAGRLDGMVDGIIQTSQGPQDVFTMTPEQIEAQIAEDISIA